MGRAEASWLGALLTLSACTETYFLALPENTDWVALVQEVGGQIPPARLVPADGSALELPGASDGNLTVVGFDEPTLSPVMDGASAEARSGALIRGASACDTPLPSPSWARALSSGGDFEESSTDELPPLTSNLFEDLRCIDDQVLGEVVCGIEGMDCVVEFSHDQRCGYTVRSCPSVGLDARVTLRGDARLCAAAPPARCRFDAALGPHGVFSCSSDAGVACEVRAHVRKPDRFELRQRIKLLDVEPRRPTEADQRPLESHHRFVEGQGYASSFTVLNDRLVTASYGGEFSEHATCTVSTRTELHFHDPVSGAAMGTRSSTNCIADLASTEDGAMLVAIEQPGSGPQRPVELALLNATGERRRSVRLEIPLLTNQGWDGLWLRRIEGNVFVASLAQTGTADFGQRTFLVRFTVDPSAGIITLDPPRLYTAAPASRGRHLTGAVSLGELIALPDSANPSGVVWLDRRTLDVVHEWFADGALNLGRRPFFAVEAATGELIVNALGATPSTFVFEGPELRRAAREYEQAQTQPMEMAVWPADPRYVLSTSYTGDAHAVLFDAEERHFEPGLLPLGFGMPRAVRTSGDTVWVLLPWEPSLVQVGPVNR